MAKLENSTNNNRNLLYLSKNDNIIETIVRFIRNGEILTGDALPSINVAAQSFGVARKTVVRAYEKLKKQGFVESRPRKGYYVINKQPNSKLKVLLIIHSFNGHFELLYNEFRKRVADISDVEIYFHHYNINILELIINRNIDSYDLFLISSFDHPRISKIIGRIPANKVLIISRNDRLKNKYNEIVQDFAKGTSSALFKSLDRIKKYKSIILSFPLKSGHPKTLTKGFEQFCSENMIPCQIVDSLQDIEICKDNIYLVIDDADLIQLLKICKIRNWKLASDVGVISYNETPLKEIIRDGISVISCNFKTMAIEMAEFIKTRQSIQKVIPIEFIERNSL